ncbi:MAG: LysM peptidoglycan-binding domain-containing protein [Anaerolineales bacterium]|nr:LysM peptidoglycan-binding domain-containing protein [Anaerolineales bacterium]
MLKRFLFVVVIVALGLNMVPFHRAEAAPSPQACAQTHTVQVGQNLFRIGLMYGVQWPLLAQWNNLANPNLIYVGQVLCVSGPNPVQVVVPANAGGGAVYPGNPFGPTTQPRIYFPKVTLNQNFELRGYNFPANTSITIGLTTLGNLPYVPYYTASTDASGQFYVLINLPPALASAATVAVEARTATGYYAKNWFYN